MKKCMFLLPNPPKHITPIQACESTYWCFLMIFYGIYIVYGNPGHCTTDKVENLKGWTQQKFISWSYNVCFWLVGGTPPGNDLETQLSFILWLCHFWYKASKLPWMEKGHEGLMMLKDHGTHHWLTFPWAEFSHMWENWDWGPAVCPDERGHSCGPWLAHLCLNCFLFFFTAFPFLCNLPFSLLQCEVLRYSPRVGNLWKHLKIHNPVKFHEF